MNKPSFKERISQEIYFLGLNLGDATLVFLVYKPKINILKVKSILCL